MLVPRCAFSRSLTWGPAGRSRRGVQAALGRSARVLAVAVAGARGERTRTRLGLTIGMRLHSSASFLRKTGAMSSCTSALSQRARTSAQPRPPRTHVHEQARGGTADLSVGEEAACHDPTRTATLPPETRASSHALPAAHHSTARGMSFTSSKTMMGLLPPCARPSGARACVRAQPVPPARHAPHQLERHALDVPHGRGGHRDAGGHAARRAG